MTTYSFHQIRIFSCDAGDVEIVWGRARINILSADARPDLQQSPENVLALLAQPTASLASYPLPWHLINEQDSGADLGGCKRSGEC